MDDHTASDSSVRAGSLDLKRQPLVLYGADIRTALPRLIRDRGWTRVLPVVTGSLTGSPHVGEALAGIGAAGLPVFGRLKPHTPFEVVLDLCAEIRADPPDAIVVVGGGSAIDAVKISALAASAGVSTHEGLRDLRAVSDAQGVQRPSPAERHAPVLVAVPTTLSGAEFGLIGGATETQSGLKHLFRADTLAPDVILYDPALALATPLDLWLSTGIRAVDHAVETVLSRDANPFTDALAFRALALLRQGLCDAKRDPGDLAARHRAQLGCWLAASGIGRVRYGASHGIGHQLGAEAGVPHGITSCVLLPAVLAFNLGMSGPAQTEIAAAFGRPEHSAEDAVREFIASLALPVRISDLGVETGALQRIAENSLGNALVRANLRPISGAADVMTILRHAY